MKLNPHLKLRRIGSMYLVVDNGTGEANLANVYHLNETAATIWRTLEEAQGATLEEEALADAVCRAYEIDHLQALADVRELLTTWKKYGLIINE